MSAVIMSRADLKGIFVPALTKFKHFTSYKLVITKYVILLRYMKQ